MSIEEYELSHVDPRNRLCHLVGIPMILVSLPVLIFWPWVGFALFTVGWIFQLVGHFFEKKKPAFTSNPKFLWVGVKWWWGEVTRPTRKKP